MLVTGSNGNEIGIHLFDNMNFKILSIKRCSISELFLEQGYRFPFFYRVNEVFLHIKRNDICSVM